MLIATALQLLPAAVSADHSHALELGARCIEWDTAPCGQHGQHAGRGLSGVVNIPRIVARVRKQRRVDCPVGGQRLRGRERSEGYESQRATPHLYVGKTNNHALCSS
jgi:hypothetical protein